MSPSNRPHSAIYRRRRIAAAAVAVFVVGGLATVALGLTGGGHAKAHAAPARRAAPKRIGPELAAVPPAGAIAEPKKTIGTGAFVTVANGIEHRNDAPASAGDVAITFDDGPGPLTQQFLEVLESQHVRATFFVKGQEAAAHPDVVRAERAAGMVIGDHTWSHPLMTKIGARAESWQIRTTQAALKKIIGVRPRFFRPPYWAWDRTTSRLVAQAGMVSVLFTVNPQDYDLPGVNRIIDRALTVRPGGVIALHDAGGDRQQTLDALRPIIEGLRAHHLRMVTLDELYPTAP